MIWILTKKPIFLFCFFLVACSSPSSSTSSEEWRIGLQKHLLALPAEKLVYLEGFLYDLFALLAEKMQMQLRLVEGNKPELLAELDQGEMQAVVAFSRFHASPDEEYALSSPLIDLGTYLVLRVSGHAVPSDLSDQLVGYATQRDRRLLLGAYPRAILRSYDSYRALLLALVAGEIDAVAVQKVVASGYINEFYPGELRFLSSPLEEDPLCLLLEEKSAQKLLPKFNDALSSISSSQYAHLEEKWGLTLR